MPTLTPCLWFDGNAEEAACFYAAIFPDATFRVVSRYGPRAPFPAGTALVVEFTLAGQRFQGLNGGPQFPFTEAVSLSVLCRDQAEVDHYWAALCEAGQPGRCGWLKDRYGLSWQIVPEALARLQQSDDAAAVGRVIQAMLGMDKLDVAALERAATGA